MAHAGDGGLIPGSGSSAGEGNCNPFQYSCLENPMDRGAWWVRAQGVTKNCTQLSDLVYIFPKEYAEKTKIMTTSPITSWQIDGKKVETVTDFIFLGCKIIGDGDWSHEIKRRFLKKSYDKPHQYIKKQRNSTIKRNTFELFLMKCMKLESIIWSEVS